MSYGTWVMDSVGHLKKQIAERAKFDISKTSLTIIDSVAGNFADLEDGSAWDFTFVRRRELQVLDLLDLYDSLIFFRGDSNGEGAQEELARQIALQGREWSKTYWRREDAIAYSYKCVLVRMFLEYARIMSLDRENDLPRRGRNTL
ncbi:hypothetical protein F5051DRAFT_470469 [Lentinula edodes]|nr:hypothetical protein F5051DRAFT_470469 [Lentinula edodes]